MVMEGAGDRGGDEGGDEYRGAEVEIDFEGDGELLVGRIIL